jgi:hypothetical protein
MQDLIREKNYYQSYLFVLNNAYIQQKPFSYLVYNMHKRVSRGIIIEADRSGRLPDLDGLITITSFVVCYPVSLWKNA